MNLPYRRRQSLGIDSELFVWSASVRGTSRIKVKVKIIFSGNFVILMEFAERNEMEFAF